MNRVYNFSAGPSMLPLEVLERAQAEMLSCGETGQSVLEMSHRSKAYEPIIAAAAENLKKLMHIPDTYEVLFVQGGASMQFAMVPLNLMTGSGKADYVNSGNFARLSMQEARRYGNAREVASSQAEGYTHIPKLDPATFDPEADYFHITTNNTIYGTRYTTLPETGNVPLVADMSSNILSEEMDVTKFGLIYAGAQKNIGPAGMAVVIIRKDLIGRAGDNTPVMLNYATYAKNGSMYNTPPTYTIYVANLVFEWLLAQGGVAAIEKRNRMKAAMLYDFLDQSKLFRGTAEKADRSLMNVTFVLPTAEQNDEFVKLAASEGLVNIKGHRSVGGMRASIYNGMPVEGVEKLVALMKQYEKTH